MSWFPTSGTSNANASFEISNGEGGASGLSSQLWDLLVTQDIVPGATPGYQTCKTIYAYHPLGRKMVELPLEKAFSQERQYSFDNPEIPIAEELIRRFRKEWKKLGGIGANTIIYRIGVLSRIYGVGTLLCGTRGEDPNSPLDYSTIHRQELYFSMLDPLNTAGSLVLQQDPTAPDFLQPQKVWAAGKDLSTTRTAVLIHEQPIWIEWTDSAFGFIGRSVYQRAFYPLKSYLYSMVADNEIQRKLMLLIAKMEQPGSVLDNRTLRFFGLRRQQLKNSSTGNVLSIGREDAIESLDLHNTDTAGTYARNNIIRNVAAASGMPAILLLDERLADGFGEGSEDAKEISIFVDSIRQQLSGIFSYIDKIVMHRAWNRDWYESAVKNQYSDYANIDYEAAFYQWQDSFEAVWPELYRPSENEVLESEEKMVDTTIRVYQAIAPTMDPVNQASLLEWVQGQIQGTKHFCKEDIDFDPEAFVNDVIEQREQMAAQAEADPTDDFEHGGSNKGRVVPFR